MREQHPMTQTIKASEVRQNWSQVLNQVARKQTRVLVEKSGIPVAALVSAEDLERLNHLEEQRERGFAAMDRISAAFAEVPVEELEAEVTKAIATVRAASRARERAAAKQS